VREGQGALPVVGAAWEPLWAAVQQHAARVLGVWWDGGQCAGGEVLHPGGSGNPLSHCLAAPPAAEVTMWVHEEKLGDRNLTDVRGVGATRGCGGDGGGCGATGLLLYGISVSCWILLAAVAGAGSLAHLPLLLGIN